MSSVSRRGFAALAALAAGALWGLCFSSRPSVWLPWIALFPLFVLIRSERRVILALLHGIGAWGVGIYWLGSTLHTYGQLPRSVAFLLLGVLVVYLALFHALFAALGGSCWRRGSWAGLLVLPALWVSLEWMRAHLFSGFPWNLAAYSWVEVPGALPLCAFIGSYGLSFLVLFTNAAAAHSLRRRRWEPIGAALLLAGLALAVGARFGPTGSAEALETRRLESLPAQPVRIVQPNIDNMVTVDWELAAANYRRLWRLTERSCDRDGALVIWPESAAWPWSYDHPFLRQDIARLVERGCSLLFNTSRQVGERSFNSALVVSAEGAGIYDKHHLVPWGEYVPLGRVLPFIGYLARNAAEFTAGEELGLLAWGRERLGVAICFEVIFPQEVARRVRNGATLLVTITNDSWYGDTTAPWQHLRAARFRAAETDRPVLRAAITGVSAIIDRGGGLEATLGVGEEGVLRTTLAGRRTLTPYSRFPWGVPLLAVTITLIGIGSGWRSTGEQGDRDGRSAIA